MKTNKLIRTSGILALALALAGCRSDTDKTVSGIIYDGSMNTLAIVTAQGDTLEFSTMDADRSQMNGLLIGDSATVTYTGTATPMGNPEIAVATSVVTRHIERASDRLVGSWTEPAPGQEGQKQGIVIEPYGVARSINMATLRYEGWSSTGSSIYDDACTVVLRGQSIGNGQTIAFSDTMRVDKLDADSLVLSRGGYTMRLAREK
ncbi:MAG: lipocalin family protein [Rikenellaceae bacterium]|nr:lipocalin family protein [Rikenellaceae bacterium]